MNNISNIRIIHIIQCTYPLSPSGQVKEKEMSTVPLSYSVKIKRSRREGTGKEE